MWGEAWRETWHHTRTHVADALQRAFAVAVATVLVATTAIGITAALRGVALLRAKLTVAVFLDAGASKVQTETTTGLLRRLEGVDSISIKTPEMVQREFASRFGNDIDRLLPENPFPSQVTLYPDDELRTKSGLEALCGKAERIRNVAEASYSAAFAEAVDTRRREAVLAAWLASGMIVCAMLLLVWNATAHAPLAPNGIPMYAVFVGLVGICAGALMAASGWLVLIRELTWLADVPRSPVVWSFIGMFVVMLLFCAAQMRFPQPSSELA